MSRSANPLAVGAFVVGSLLLTFLLLFFSGSNLFSRRDTYMLLYDTSIKGLNVGAPVTIKGVKIGEVTDIRTSIYGKSATVLNTVTVEIDPGVIERPEGQRAKSLDQLVERGLRAQLKMQSLLTGLLYIDVDFQADKPAQFKNVKTPYPQLPTIPTGLEQLTRDLESIDIGKLTEDLQEIVSSINTLVTDPAVRNAAQELGQTLAAARVAADNVSAAAVDIRQSFTPLANNANTLVTTLNHDVPQLAEKIDKAVAALQESAASVNRSAANTAFLTSDDSPLLYRINNAALSVDAAAERLRNLTDMLERQPEALLYGKQED